MTSTRATRRNAAGSRDVELPRGDLAAIPHAVSRDRAEFLYDDSIVAVDRHDGGVNVSFHRAPPCRFDLLIGADGLHSAARRLAFSTARGRAPCHTGG